MSPDQSTFVKPTCLRPHRLLLRRASGGVFEYRVSMPLEIPLAHIPAVAART
jgi:hypothetical protein